MYIHLGNNKIVRVKSIVGIFDMDNSTVSSITRGFLRAQQKKYKVETVSTEIPKSFVLYKEKDEYTICMSPLSASALRGRLEDSKNGIV